MTNHHKPHYGPSDPEKASHGGGGTPPPVDIKTDRAEKARVGGQHSNGGTRRRDDK
ncbi:general stress protein [Pseudomonas capeferrum]|uniref:general stress protein n=1 Tax=Pseudomonas capeferrum TaxID=1495066 RepID=UPI0015E35A5B|nr:general stress protein [Pseudomonas capeferrum]MBA1203809.1 general stress protein [Pseudomonas capeferrum]